jgi:WbqC-like protein family
MTKRVAIIQSNYIPWKGYFNIIKCVDHFVLLDDVQYTRRDWRNRNLIKTKAGLKWLTIPVAVKNNYHIKIEDVHTDGSDWRRDHWNQLKGAYGTSQCFNEIAPFFEELYLRSSELNLSKINYSFIKVILSILSVDTSLSWSREFPNAPTGKTERLLHICKKLNATEYLSGMAAKDYLDVELFERENIKVVWADYSGYQPYKQLHPPFEHGVSILDMLFNEGTQSTHLLMDRI